MDAVVAFLREFRDRKGLSQEALAEVAGMSLRQYNRWETGAKGGAIKGEALLRVMDFLGAPFEEIRGLLRRPDASREEGRRFAAEWFTDRERQYAEYWGRHPAPLVETGGVRVPGAPFRYTASGTTNCS